MGDKPMPKEKFVAMMNDVFLKIWKPYQKDNELSTDEYTKLLETVDEIIDKYKEYTYTTESGERKAYVENYAITTLTIIMANEKEKRQEQKKLLDILNGIS
ncbi:hypothetical protein SAMN05216349_13917 [Oribacterium sp. KHPX15]|uniref:hypothetical protein n=1 Tax=unclassified Oribacterium TaxID=2629782 RepID=UPI0004E0B429|nr:MULTISPECIES: hypothetical protein [unclassified Oribacterium]SEA86104.1 hypothetical protein SAMN05216349_13917 [Oribacterium sp. KHPX15]